ncbi:uncharacterized protein LOC107879046 [Capsicum annuum]|uniref:uncharacterized protein LOC107879046 n=1 Tax=Capsicum annuum TaxID=4072 RepID=UPI0007BF2773|nr:uncharacterized protein LOC107879046 [Capsicum annuum]
MEEVKKWLPLPFPQKYIKAKEDALFKKFSDTFKELHINLPLLDVLHSMPKYLRDVVAKKVKLQDVGAITFTKECNTIMTQKIPKKLKDQGKFSIPIQIGSKDVHALSDLGKSINLMPLSLFEKLGLGKLRSTTVILQIADDSMAYPKGIIEDILIKVDEQVPIILRRPVLETGGALIDVREGTLKMRVDYEEMVFDIYKTLIKNSFYTDLCMINVLEKDECGVPKPLKTSSDYLVEWPKMKPPFSNMLKGKRGLKE